ncbi:uncharacterized protein LOC112087286 [Eutrema salsugineum]|uniref:uncharacterized protein LOC112087286 n=1 Tax=Eutrema salsugineum TaxID=72664 RepID=UPI000CED5019|nr:uncharacterized protein LOC112087286 [Eutrema salsugineum]
MSCYRFRRSKSYAATAQRGTKFYAAKNEMMAGYEANAYIWMSVGWKRQGKMLRHTKSTLRKVVSDNARVQYRNDVLEEEKRASKVDLEKMAARFEESRARKNSDIASLKRQIEAKKAILESQLKRAKKEARHEEAAKCQERLTKVDTKISELEKAKNDENELGQIRSNLLLIRNLQKPDATLDTEEEKLKSWKAELTGADVEFEPIVTDLRGQLVISPFSLDSVDSRLGTKPVEVAVAGIEVTYPTGPNIDTPRAGDLAAEVVSELRHKE